MSADPTPSTGSTAGGDVETWVGVPAHRPTCRYCCDAYDRVRPEVAQLRSDLGEVTDRRNTLQRERDIFDDQSESLRLGLQQELAANGDLIRDIAKLRAVLLGKQQTIESLLSGMESYVLEIRDLHTDLAHAQAERDNWAEGCGVDHIQRIKALSAQVEAMRGVVAAVRTWRDLSEEAAGKRLIGKAAWLAIQDAATAVLEALDVLDQVKP